MSQLWKIGLAWVLLSTAACAQAARPEPGQDLRTYMAQVQALSEDAHPRPPSSTEVTYSFTCDDQRHILSLRTDDRGGEGAHAVRLIEMGGVFGNLSTDDSAEMQSELDQFASVESVTIRCASPGRYGFLISGRGPGDASSASTERSRLLWFDQGRIVRVVTY